MKQMELLAPAGNMASVYAAINNGADAIYLSGEKFGARAYIENFSEKDIYEIIRFSHLVGVKVYVTVNTLVKDSELKECLNYVKGLYENDVDAILIQDMGLALLLHQVFPDLVMHASTQMNIKSVEEAKEAKQAGFKRIVLARECSLDTVKEIKKQVEIEVEVFAHGAMCMSYSGNCLLSSLIGGRSGNRGRCAGACRKKYKLVKDNEVISDDAYFLSLNDLSTYKHIDKLKEANIDSIKLEGRVKREEYVAFVTRLYRNALDNKLENTKKLDYELKEMFNRGYSGGFILNEANSSLTNTLYSNHYGVEIGYVLKVVKNYCFIKIDNNNYNSLRLGDSIRIFDTTIEDGITLSNIDVYNDKYQKLHKIQKDEYVKKGSIIGITTHLNLKEGMKVVKTTAIDLLNEYKVDSQVIKKVPISGLIFEKNNHLALELKYTDAEINVKVCELSEEELQDANTDYLDRIKTQIDKINDTFFYFKNLEIKMRNAFLVISKINELRRKAIISLENAILYARRARIHEDLRISKFDFPKEAKIEEANSFNLYVKVHKLEQYYVAKELGIENIISDLEELKDLDGIIYMNDRMALSNKGVSIDNKISSVYLNVLNSFSVYEAYLKGINTVGISPELKKEEIIELINSYKKYFKVKPNLLMLVYGYEEAMIMKHCLINKYYKCEKLSCGICSKGQFYLRDGLNYDFPLMRANNCNMVLYNANRLHLLKYLNEIKEMGINNILLDFTIEDKEETKKVLSAYIDKVKGKDMNIKIDNYTYGHFIKGIE